MGRRDETETMGSCADVGAARGPSVEGDGGHGPMTRAVAGFNAGAGFDAQVQCLTPARAAPPAFERAGPWVPPAMWFERASEGAEAAPVQRSEGRPGAAPAQWPQPALDAREMCPVDTELDPSWRLDLARECVNRVGRELLEMLEAGPGAVDARTLDRLRDAAHERLRAIEHALWLRGGGEEGPDAGAVTHLLATAVGPNTLGPHLRPRARQQVAGASAGRLAAATAALAGAEVLNRKYLRGVLSGLISDLFADVRGVSGSVPEVPAGGDVEVAHAEAVDSAPEGTDAPEPEAGAGDEGARRESLLTHLREQENTAHTIDGGLAQALDGAKAPPPGTRLPVTLDHVYRARPSLASLFFEGTSVGKSLNTDLATIRVEPVDGSAPRGFDPNRGGGYYRLLREQVRTALDGSVRAPTVMASVLRTPVPRLPEPVKEAIRAWLKKTRLPDRSLPMGVRASIRDALKTMRLEMHEEGDLVRVTLDAAVRAKVQGILASASAKDPERVAVYAWWQQHIDRPERHHMWPKWLLGDEAQVGMMLPRCIHNMAGVGLDDGGFHQVLNRLFSEEPEFSGLRVEDPEEFRDYFRDLAPESRRREALQTVRGLLIRTYRIVLGDQGMVTRVAGRLANEMARIPVEVRR